MSNIGIRQLAGIRQFALDSGVSWYPKHCHRCCRLLDLCTCRCSHADLVLTESRKLSEEADKRDKRITDLEEQVESFEQLVADLMVTVKSLNDRINGR